MNSKQTCPLCQADNNCQAHSSSTPCWCTTYSFPKQLNDKLKKTPNQCICSTCAQKFGAINQKTNANAHPLLIHKNKELPTICE